MWTHKCVDLTPHGFPLWRRDPCVCANLCSAATEDVTASVDTTATQPPPPAKLPLPRAKMEAAEVNQRQWGTSTPSVPVARQRKRDALKQLLRHAIFGRPNGTRAVVSAWLMSVITAPLPAAPPPAAAAEGTAAARTPGEGSGSTPARATQTQAPPPATLDLSSNQFGAEGLRRLFVGWARGKVTVTKLNLSNNCLGEQAGVVFGKALETNASLKTLLWVPWCPTSVCPGGALDKLDA